MTITYKETFELPNKELHELFMSVGWSDGKEDDFKLNNFNAPFKDSTLVISAWDDDILVEVVRVISDKIIRTVIQDLAVLPKYQRKGIGTQLLKRCIDAFPKSEILVPTTKSNVPFYEKHGFIENNGVFLSIPSKWF